MGSIEDHKTWIIEQYTKFYQSAARIAKELGVSRQGVILALQSWGFDTSKYANSWVWFKCSYSKCGREYQIRRKDARRKLENREKGFCSMECRRKGMIE